jgi:hypothetical protein
MSLNCLGAGKLRWKAQKCGVLMVCFRYGNLCAKENPRNLTTVFLSSSLPFSNVFRDSVGVGGLMDEMRMRMQKVTCLSKVLGGDLRLLCADWPSGSAGLNGDAPGARLERLAVVFEEWIGRTRSDGGHR